MALMTPRCQALRLSPKGSALVLSFLRPTTINLGRRYEPRLGGRLEVRRLSSGRNPNRWRASDLFLRGLFHATFMCQRSARLITRTHDWDQQASRGFAAELLAPRAAVVAAVPADLDEDERADAIAGLRRPTKSIPR